MVAEYSTSRHDVFSISCFFKKIKFTYQSLYKEPIYFRLIVIDYSWALIHSILDEFTNETPLDYAERVFKLANGELKEFRTKSWLCSCAAHTMKRYSDGLKKKLKLSEFVHHFYCYAFSLLLNSKTLDKLKTNFRSIAVVSLSQFKNSTMNNEFEKIQFAIKERNDSEINKTIIIK